MLYAYVDNGIVKVIIQAEDPDFPGVPLSNRYEAKFLSKCVEIPENTTVETGYLYTDGVFSVPPATDPDDGAELEVTDDGTPEPTLRERVTQLEGDNTTLSAQLKAATESNAFLEECIVEMAGIVYA